jgi:phospholipase D1/2
MIFEPSRNCWVVNRANFATLLIDCDNFYRALHKAIIKAQHSIFILGWDIDSRVRLLRGEEERKSLVPSVVVDLLAWKAKQNPEIQIYLLRWDSSIAFAGERELPAEYNWTMQTPANLSICLDNSVPMGGSQHQKVFVIDDELVFTGGMDIAPQRWDTREHLVVQPEREDDNGPYGPYHDAQIMLSGPIVSDFAKLVRWRWQRAAGYLPKEQRLRVTEHLPPTWPEGFAPFFKNVKCAIARTIPRLEDDIEAQEVREMYLDLIASAKNFIYIENQFLTSTEIAHALNQRLLSIPALRVLIVSSYSPQGIFERVAMWAGRLDFKKILESGISKERVRMTCAGITDQHGKMHYKRIHSKIFVVDDQHLVVASSNLSNRSMALDTECDLVIAADTDEISQKILAARNDLLGEHTSRSADEVAAQFAANCSLDSLLSSGRINSYRLMEIDDTIFTDQSLQPVAQRIADPEKPLINTDKPLRNPRKHYALLAAVLLILSIVIFAFIQDKLKSVQPDTIRAFLEMARSSPMALPAVCLVYILSGFIFFPLTLLSLITAAVFGSVLGPIYGMTGALVSSALMFYLGRLAGLKWLRKLTGDRIREIDHRFRKAGIIGVTVLRLLPIAPNSLVNLAAGISSVSFFDFMVGSFLGFLPGFLAKGIVGDSLVQIFLHPTVKTTTFLILGIILWIGLILGSYFIAKRWRKKQAL